MSQVSDQESKVVRPEKRRNWTKPFMSGIFASLAVTIFSFGMIYLFFDPYHKETVLTLLVYSGGAIIGLCAMFSFLCAYIFLPESEEGERKEEDERREGAREFILIFAGAGFTQTVLVLCISPMLP